MSVLDIVFIIPIVWLAYNGFKKGLIVELATFFALILGVYVSLYFSDITAEFLSNTANMKTKYLSLISFIVTFILVVLAVNLIGKLVSKLIDTAALGFINKSAGGLFGILKAVVFLSFLLFFVLKVDKKHVVLSKTLTEESLFYPYIQPFAPELIAIYGELDFENMDTDDITDKVLHTDI